MTRPLPVQVNLLRQLLGLTQEQLAKTLGLKQTHVSRLEKADSDHLITFYQRAAEKMGAHLVLVPDDMVIIPKSQFKRLASARV